MTKCVFCLKTVAPKERHSFTTKEPLRGLWLTALTPDDAARATLDSYLRDARGRQFICASHFSDDSYDETPNYKALKPNAVPKSIRTSPSTDPILPYSPPSTPFFSLPPTPLARPVQQSTIRLAEARVPPCCRCCCKRETPMDKKKDPDWEEEEKEPEPSPSPTITNLPDAEYFIVSKPCLVQLLSRCNKCPSGQNSLTFSEDAHALSCKCKCTGCGDAFTWSNSPVLNTANASSKEKLRKVNVDVMAASAVTAVGTAKLNQFLNVVGLNRVSKTTFHRHKNEYLFPAVTEVFNQAQEAIFSRLRDRISRGEQIDVAGDGSFDSRGYNAEWCRYFLVDAQTGEVLIYVLMSKKETGSSGKLEVACLEKALNELADKIGGVKNIGTLVTDRHSAVTKMMRDQYPSINHFYDPWHYFRNLTTNLLKITKPNYMAVVKVWTRTLVNKAYAAVVTAQGNGDLASEMFRSSLYCISGVHDFSNDSLFKHFKKCTHPPPDSDYSYIAKDGHAYKRLAEVIYTEKNIEDIKSVSYLLKTSTCESLNALAWRYSPKEDYFTRKGHELRTMMTMIHCNELKQDEIAGNRVVTGQKSYYNRTLKKNVNRDVKTPAKNMWRPLVMQKCYEVRSSLASTPYATMKLEKEKQKAIWNQNNLPSVPHHADPNLDASDDEDEEDRPIQSDGD